MTSGRIGDRIDGAIARLTLNRPEKRNAIDEQTIADLLAALKRASEEPSVRVVAISGAGDDFCSGMDLAALEESAGAGSLEFLDSAERLADLYRAIRRHFQPVVALVRGRALGGGCGIAMACDAILAAESAQFGFPEVNLGFVPAIVMGLLRLSVGERIAFDLLTSGERIPAREALRIGMITRVFPDAEFEASAGSYLAALAAKSGSAIALTKRLLHTIEGTSLDAALDAGAHINALARTTVDARQGFEQFMKRKKRP